MASNLSGIKEGQARTSASFGSSVYGGRPTFMLVREEGKYGGTVTLYELLPREQATARKERLERVNRSLVIEESISILDDEDENEGWSWNNWVAVKIAGLSESHLRSVFPVVKESISHLDVDATAVTSSGEGRLLLPETVGIRLVLTFAGVKPIQRVDRMRAFARGIARMSDEECYYWYAKCRSPSSPNGEKALRTLLTNHVN
jgi:hypothetical protein